MAKSRQTTKKTSKADTATTDIASTDGIATPDITLPSLAQDYLQNKDEIMSLLLQLTKALKEERAARQDMENRLADMETRLKQVQHTAHQQTLRLPNTIKDNLDRDIEEMLIVHDAEFADRYVNESVEELAERMDALEQKLKDVRRELPNLPDDDNTLVEESEGHYLTGDAKVWIEVDRSSDILDVDMLGEKPAQRSPWNQGSY